MMFIVEVYIEFAKLWRDIKGYYVEGKHFDTEEEARAWIADVSPEFRHKYRVQGDDYPLPISPKIEISKKSKPVVVTQLQYAAVKETHQTVTVDGVLLDEKYWHYIYDCWKWNSSKNKWVRLSNSACGFGKKSNADKAAQEINDEILTWLKNHTPTPL